jgi:6-phosphogluconolactonase
MKTFLPMILSAALASTAAQAADATFYIGTYTKPGKSQGIYVGTLNTETGKLGPLKLAAETKNPSFVALSPNGKYLYACGEGGGGGLAAFAVQPDGTLKPLNQGDTGGAGACHVTVDATGGTVLAANYGGGSIAAFPTKPDGSLGDRSAFVQYTGSGPNPKRQKEPHAHSIYTDAANKFVYSPDLGTDNVWIFKLDPAKGTLTATEPPSGKVPPGSGPRHFAIHPNGKLAFANNEMTLTATAFKRDESTGALTAIETVSTLPEGTQIDGFSTAEIFCHPTGKWLYVSNRTHDTIAVFSIAADGKLKLIENAPAGVKVPRGFGLDPSGKWLITGGQNDDRIAVHKIDPATGKLTLTSETAEVGSPVCVLFAPGK